MINLDYKKRKGIYWVSLFIDRNTPAYFDSFEIEYIYQKILNRVRDKSINHTVFRIQDAYILCGFYCIGFIDYMLDYILLIDYITLLDYTNLFFPNDY